jgi:hypothetical protein
MTAGRAWAQQGHAALASVGAGGGMRDMLHGEHRDRHLGP